MSTKSKLLAMTENLQLPEPSAEAGAVLPAPPSRSGDDMLPADRTQRSQQTFPPVEAGRPARTGPGQMLQFRGQMLAAEGEMGKLRDQLKEHEGSAPTRKLDPQSISPSRWANRHPDAFNTSAFVRLKQDIEAAGGNVQPILVRPISDQPGHYEIVFGHRRHRACNELGIQVLATIDNSALSDHELFSAMDRENRERADLSPYEQGTMYRRALDEKFFPSNRRLAEALGLSHTWVGNVLQVADLPPSVVECFKSPLEIQHRHAKEIAAALEMDRKGVLRRADKLRAGDKSRSASAVVSALTGTGPDDPASPREVLEADGKPVGKWSRDRAGRLTIQIDAAALAGDGHLSVLAAIASALAAHQV